MLHRRSTFPVHVVKELRVVPVQFRHDVRLKYIGTIRHESPQQPPVVLVAKFAEGWCSRIFHRRRRRRLVAASFLRHYLYIVPVVAVVVSGPFFVRCFF